MKKDVVFSIALVLAVTAISLALLLSVLANAQHETRFVSVSPEPRLITVTGDADVNVVPDEIILTLGVETNDKDLALAKSQNDERVKSVLEIAKANEVEEKHIQTSHMSIEPRYRSNYENREFMGYFVKKTIVITIKDTMKFEDILTDLLEGGADRVDGIQFRTTELRKHKDQARILAINAAKEKADDMAGELGQKVGKPYMIQESQTNYLWDGSMAQNAIQNVDGGYSIDESSIALGQIRVNAKVTVSFELE